MLANSFGHFDPTGRSFVITDPRTPMPWVNVICNGRYGLVVSQNGGGFSFFDDAQHCVLTRWDMDLVRDTSGKFLYVSDLESGVTWSAAPAPCFPKYTRYQCVHGAGSTSFFTEYDGIQMKWTLGVAPDEAVEVWAVELLNASGRERRLRVASYLEWSCGVAPDAKREFHRLFFTTRHDEGRRAILATKNMWDIPPKREKDHWNQPWPYVAGHAVGGFRFTRSLAIGDKSRFLGRYTPITTPVAMQGAIQGAGSADHEGAGGGFGRFGDACAALGGDLVLRPNEVSKGYFLLSIADEESRLLAQLDEARDGSRVDSTIAAAKEFWARRLSQTSVESDRPDFDLLNNYWLPYQAISGRMWGRTGYYQQSGAFGFRDQLQDSQVWLPIDPAFTRKQILLHASRQFIDGSVNHWWHALADFGNHTSCSDDYLWLAFVTANYIKETGDRSILHEQAAWMDDPSPATILEHCTRAIGRGLTRLSPRGIPLIGACDWNDGLSAMGVGGKGESVWVGMFLCQILGDFEHLNGDDWRTKSYHQAREKLVHDINAHLWDGEWYQYGTKDSGEAVGSKSCTEGQIHLNAQTWAILADVATKERGERAWRSVKERLLSAYGPLLLAPAYTTPDPDLGYITRYSPGSRENGGVYMHAATWALAAACKVRDVESVGAIWKSISPPTRGQEAEAYWAEPYVTPGNVDGPLSDLPGRAGWTWYTGSAAWLNRVSLEWVLGIRPGWKGLEIDPCAPEEFGRVSVQRVWRGKTIRVRFDAAEFRAGEKPVLFVDGKRIEGNVITPAMLEGAGRAVDVQVSWGAGVSGVGVAWPEPTSRGRADAKTERTVR